MSLRMYKKPYLQPPTPPQTWIGHITRGGPKTKWQCFVKYFCSSVPMTILVLHVPWVTSLSDILVCITSLLGYKQTLTYCMCMSRCRSRSRSRSSFIWMSRSRSWSRSRSRPRFSSRSKSWSRSKSRSGSTSFQREMRIKVRSAWKKKQNKSLRHLLLPKFQLKVKQKLKKNAKEENSLPDVSGQLTFLITGPLY